jgi:hypothetical protein
MRVNEKSAGMAMDLPQPQATFRMISARNPWDPESG